MNQSTPKTNDAGAALTLMVMAPLLTEILPGATRLSSIFVLPIEILVWGGGALLIRYAVRKWQLGWPGMLFLAIALSLAEEFLIQQTSIAPMVINLKGEVYARSLGVNYVYFLWAVIYEPVFVVFLSVYLVELIFPDRRERPWISKGGLFAVIPLFFLGSFMAWFTWTRIARPKVFHVPVYNPPLITILIAVIMIVGLIYMAFSRSRKIPNHPLPTPYSPTSPAAPASTLAASSASLNPPIPAILFLAGVIWASLLFGLVLLGFGIDPAFPPAAALAGGILLIVVPLSLIPKWVAHQHWRRNHVFALIFGVVLGSMGAGHIGFLETTGPDLYFKIITNSIAIILLILLGRKVNNGAAEKPYI